MGEFKINFRLQDLDKICPWGREESLSLHWFGLTDGELWLTAGSQTIYEYSEAARKYFACPIRYNDYQIARFLEDFLYTFRCIGESIPACLYDELGAFEAKTDAWKESHMDDEDAVFDRFYDNEYEPLIRWFYDRTFDSMHLVGGPMIGCFRFADKIKLLWESSYQLENGESIWTAPAGIVEMPYKEFVSSVKAFYDSFFAAMDKQVENAVAKDWGNVALDKERLVEENKERRLSFLDSMQLLNQPGGNTEWNKIVKLYDKMKAECPPA
ncbi:MAG: DUF5984 family protein [Clostridium sp.]|nr:DUF5984 family protein [Clostridium sp.]